ncbi:MAG: hypothetical protein AAGI34_19195 [Pseudomonadota bacterium]
MLTTPAGTDQVNGSYRLGGFRWSSGSTVYLLAGLKQFDNRVAVCGAWAADGGTAGSSQFNSQAVQMISVTVDGETVAAGFGFARRFDWQGIEGLARQGTDCVLSDLAWQSSYAAQKPEFVIPRLRFID